MGLGPSPEMSRIRVFWPGGEVETWSGLGAGRYHDLVAGTGQRDTGRVDTGQVDTGQVNTEHGGSPAAGKAGGADRP